MVRNSLRIFGMQNPFFIASTNLYNGFPLVVRENLVWGSRFPALWLTPYVAERWQDGPLPDDPIIAFALEALVTDLQNFHPDVVIINQSPAQEYIKGGTFRLSQIHGSGSQVQSDLEQL